jgi:Zn-dependent protease
MFRSLEIGRPFGIRLAVHWTFWLLPAVVFLSSFLAGNTNRAVFETVAVLGIFGCVALHELGHAVCARGFGIRTRDIELYPIGGVARLNRIPEKPQQELAIALAGPAVNIAIALFLAPLMWFDGYGIGLGAPAYTWIEAFWQRLLWANLFLAGFNLLPAFPMDGGRVLRAVLAIFVPRVRATEAAANVGTVFAVLFGVVGVFGIPGVMSPNLMLAVLGWFVYITGRAELQAVRDMEEAANYPRWAGPTAPRAGDLVSGWVYEPARRAWVEYRLGMPVREVKV